MLNVISRLWHNSTLRAIPRNQRTRFQFLIFFGFKRKITSCRWNICDYLDRWQGTRAARQPTPTYSTENSKFADARGDTKSHARHISRTRPKTRKLDIIFPESQNSRIETAFIISMIWKSDSIDFSSPTDKPPRNTDIKVTRKYFSCSD